MGSPDKSDSECCTLPPQADFRHSSSAGVPSRASRTVVWPAAVREALATAAVLFGLQLVWSVSPMVTATARRPLAGSAASSDCFASGSSGQTILE